MRRKVDGGFVFLSIEKAECVLIHPDPDSKRLIEKTARNLVKVAVILPQGVLRLVPVLVVEGRVSAPPPRLVGVVLRLLTLPLLLHPRPDRSSARVKNMAAIWFGLAWRVLFINWNVYAILAHFAYSAKYVCMEILSVILNLFLFFVQRQFLTKEKRREKLKGRLCSSHFKRCLVYMYKLSFKLDRLTSIHHVT